MPLFSVCTITLTVTELPVDVLLTFEALKDFHFLQASAVLMSLLEQAMLFRLDVFFCRCCCCHAPFPWKTAPAIIYRQYSVREMSLLLFQITVSGNSSPDLLILIAEAKLIAIC